MKVTGTQKFGILKGKSIEYLPYLFANQEGELLIYNYQLAQFEFYSSWDTAKDKVEQLGKPSDYDLIDKDWLIDIDTLQNKEKIQELHQKALVTTKTPVEVKAKPELGSRNNSHKLQWSLFDMDCFESTVRVLEFGAKKYAAHNWKKGLKIGEILDSMQRHINALRRGEDLDYDPNCIDCQTGNCLNHSGLSHVGHLGCNVMFLDYMMRNRKDLDNRYKEIKLKEINQEVKEPGHSCC